MQTAAGSNNISPGEAKIRPFIELTDAHEDAETEGRALSEPLMRTAEREAASGNLVLVGGWGEAGTHLLGGDCDDGEFIKHGARHRDGAASGTAAYNLPVI